MSKIKVYRIAPEGLNGCIEKRSEDLLVWFEDAELGDRFKIEVFEMEEAKYNALPEFTGP